jgi:hypothetical protein
LDPTPDVAFTDWKRKKQKSSDQSEEEKKRREEVDVEMTDCAHRLRVDPGEGGQAAGLDIGIEVGHGLDVVCVVDDRVEEQLPRHVRNVVAPPARERGVERRGEERRGEERRGEERRGEKVEKRREEKRSVYTSPLHTHAHTQPHSRVALLGERVEDGLLRVGLARNVLVEGASLGAAHAGSAEGEEAVGPGRTGHRGKPTVEDGELVCECRDDRHAILREHAHHA